MPSQEKALAVNPDDPTRIGRDPSHLLHCGKRELTSTQTPGQMSAHGYKNQSINQYIIILMGMQRDGIIESSQ